MLVNQPPERFVDTSDDQPIESIRPEGSRYARIDIKRLDDGVHVKAQEHNGAVTELTADTTDQMYCGVDISGKRRRDIDDDIQDALQLLGYCVVDRNTRQY